VHHPPPLPLAVAGHSSQGHCPPSVFCISVVYTLGFCLTVPRVWTVAFLQGNHIFTSGATGTNAAVIKGALRAEKPDLLTVVLPQSLTQQPPESQELLSQVKATPPHPPSYHIPLHEPEAAGSYQPPESEDVLSQADPPPPSLSPPSPSGARGSSRRRAEIFSCK